MVRTGLLNASYKINEVESNTEQASYFARSDWLICNGLLIRDQGTQSCLFHDRERDKLNCGSGEASTRTSPLVAFVTLRVPLSRPYELRAWNRLITLYSF